MRTLGEGGKSAAPYGAAGRAGVSVPDGGPGRSGSAWPGRAGRRAGEPGRPRGGLVGLAAFEEAGGAARFGADLFVPAMGRVQARGGRRPAGPRPRETERAFAAAARSRGGFELELGPAVGLGAPDHARGHRGEEEDDLGEAEERGRSAANEGPGWNHGG